MATMIRPFHRRNKKKPTDVVRRSLCFTIPSLDWHGPLVRCETNDNGEGVLANIQLCMYSLEAPWSIVRSRHQERWVRCTYSNLVMNSQIHTYLWIPLWIICWCPLKFPLEVSFSRLKFSDSGDAVFMSLVFWRLPGTVPHKVQEVLPCGEALNL